MPSNTQGDAADELIPLVYSELKKLAHSRLARERPGHTLQTTALVHEAYLRLAGAGSWENRAHFFGAAAEAMRRILVERARRAARLKRGGDQERVDLSNAPGVPPKPEDLLDLNDALEILETKDSQMATVVKLRYLVGFSVEETSEALGLSPRTVNRLWMGGRAWLLREMSQKEDAPIKKSRGASEP